jgi:general secretion pathway protein I
MSRPGPTRAPNRRAVCGRPREDGFALLEVLVAFIVLAVGLGALFSGVATAIRTDGLMMSSRGAFRVAQSRLEAAGIADVLEEGQRAGIAANNYRWRETITPVRIGTVRPETPGVVPQASANATLAPFWVEIMVQAKDGTVARLAALKLAPESKK